jgi:1-deoxy-D-xylulose-5-phosphate reductoisomerase
MRVPIAFGLSFPERIESGASRLDFLKLAALSFEPVDAKRFPGLQLAWDCLRAPPGATTVLNAANEEAVAAFLAGTIRFTAIHTVNLRTLDRMVPRLGPVGSLEEMLALDEQARQEAHRLIKELAF